jgi:hypothetical protein
VRLTLVADDQTSEIVEPGEQALTFQCLLQRQRFLCASFLQLLLGGIFKPVKPRIISGRGVGNDRL